MQFHVGLYKNNTIYYLHVISQNCHKYKKENKGQFLRQHVTITPLLCVVMSDLAISNFRIY